MLKFQSRRRAWLAIVLIVLGCAAILLNPESSTAPPSQTVAYTDIALYHDLAEQVRAGAGYYETTMRLQRTHHYPTRPFYTVRHPTLTYLAAAFGWTRLQQALLVLLVIVAGVWLVRLSEATVTERVATILAIIAGSAAISSPLLIATHELWAGLLICLALALRGGKAWWLGVIAAAAAIAFRELAVCFAVLSLVVSVAERRRTESLAWLGMIAFAVAAIAIHAVLVLSWTLPGDPVSQGWLGLRGPAAAFHDLTIISILGTLPTTAAIALALLSLLGWTAVPGEQNRIALLFLAGITVLIGVFARTQNFYWIQLALPTWLVGLGFAPRAIRDLAVAALAPRASAL